jgi:hypothetical protein
VRVTLDDAVRSPTACGAEPLFRIEIPYDRRVLHQSSEMPGLPDRNPLDKPSGNVCEREGLVDPTSGTAHCTTA